MRIDNLNESPVGSKGATSIDDAKKYVELSHTDQEAAKRIKEIKEISKKLGGYTTVMNILRVLNSIKK